MAEKAAPVAPQESLPGDAEVFVISPTGERGTIPRSALETATNRGYKLETPDQTLDAKLAEEYGDNTFDAAAQGAARSLTFGLSDVALEAAGLGEDTRRIREHNSGAALAGEVGGALLPVGGGALASAAGKAAGGAVRGAGATAGRRIAGGVAGAATEGAVFGAGQGVSELALDERPVTIERVLSVIPSSALTGAAYGAAAGGAGAMLAEGARVARSAAGKAAEKMAAQSDAAAATAKLPDDINLMDRAQLRAAREAEVAGIKAAARKDAEQVMADVRAFSDDARSAFVKTDDKAIAARLARTKGGVMKSLDDPRGWIDEPFQAKNTAKQLRIQEAALTESINSGKLSDDFLARAMDWRAKNQAAQARIKSFTDVLTTPASPRLSSLDDAAASFGDRAAAAREAAKPGMAQTIAKTGATGALASGAMAMGVPPLLAFPLAGALADKGVDVLVGRMGRKLSKASAAAQAKTAQGIERFFGKAETGIRAATPAVSKTLAAVSYATPEMVAAKPGRPAAKSGNGRVKAFRERAAELRAVTEAGPDGKPRMSMPAFREVTDRVAGVAAVAPKVADQLVMAAARRVEFMASKLPTRPGNPEVPVGPDRWHPSEMEIAKFARYADAAEDPQGVLDRMAAGKMTPEDAEAFKAVYPEMYAEVQDAIMARLPELQETLPYSKRLMLSIFFDRPVDPAMDPAVMGVLQQNYANEPGTEGGTQAPPARFASLRGNNPPQPTPAQRMSSE